MAKFEDEQASQSCIETAIEDRHGLRILGRHTDEDLQAIDTVLGRLPREVVEPIENIYVVREENLLGAPFAAAEAHPDTMSICLRRRWMDDILAHEAMHIYHFKHIKDADPKAASTLPALACSDRGCELMPASDGEMPEIARDKPQCAFDNEIFAIREKHVKKLSPRDFRNPGVWKDGYPGPRDLCSRPYGATNKMEFIATHGEALYNLCYNGAYARGRRISVWARLYPADQKEGYQAIIDTMRKHGFISEEDRAYAEKNICSDYEKYKRFLNKDEYFYMWSNPWGNKLTEPPKAK
jgi:hypothetical protein